MVDGQVNSATSLPGLSQAQLQIVIDLPFTLTLQARKPLSSLDLMVDVNL
jgi:hypothetical protein